MRAAAKETRGPRASQYVRVAARAEDIEELYRRRYRRFRETVATITGSYESARDVVQEAFARALRRRETFRGEGSLEAWVWQIAIRTALEQRHDRRLVSLDAIDPMPVEHDGDLALTAVLRQLPPRRRLMVFLRYFADLSYADIARVCGVSEGTVGAALTQARAALEQAITDEEDARVRR